MLTNLLKLDLDQNLEEARSLNESKTEIDNLGMVNGRLVMRKGKCSICETYYVNGKRRVREKVISDEKAKLLLKKEFVEKKTMLLNSVIKDEQKLITSMQELEKMILYRGRNRYQTCLGEDPYVREMNELWDWANADYPQLQYNLEEKRTRTTSGVMVRSKSEAIIANQLTQLNIPFRYEYEIILDGGKKYPDFTIKLPNGKLIIWEHMGILYDYFYAERQIEKIVSFTKEGYILGDNFILTSEGEKGFIDTEAISKLIAQIILPNFFKSAVLTQAEKRSRASFQD